MLELLENGYVLRQVGGNSGVYVASRGIRHGVYIENALEDLVRHSEWFYSFEEAEEAAAELIRGAFARVG